MWIVRFSVVMPLFLDLIINTFFYLELGLGLELGLVLGLGLGVELGLGGGYAIGSSSYRYRCSYHTTFISVV
jgi:hypothetical protein